MKQVHDPSTATTTASNAGATATSPVVGDFDAEDAFLRRFADSFTLNELEVGLLEIRRLRDSFHNLLASKVPEWTKDMVVGR